MKESQEITHIKRDIISIRNELDTTISEINNAIKMIADSIIENPPEIKKIKSKLNEMIVEINKIKKVLKRNGLV